MEPQGCYDNKKTCKKRNCLGIIKKVIVLVLNKAVKTL